MTFPTQPGSIKLMRPLFRQFGASDAFTVFRSVNYWLEECKTFGIIWKILINFPSNETMFPSMYSYKIKWRFCSGSFFAKNENLFRFYIAKCFVREIVSIEFRIFTLKVVIECLATCIYHRMEKLLIRLFLFWTSIFSDWTQNIEISLRASVIKTYQYK